MVARGNPDPMAPVMRPEPRERDGVARSGLASRSRSRAPEVARLSPSVAVDSRGLRIVMILAPLVAIGVGVAGMALSLISDPIQVVSAIVLPLVILAALGLGERPGPRLVAAIGLNIEAFLTGATSPAGMAFALVLPLIAVGLVQSIVRGRALHAVFGMSALTAVLGVGVAVTIGPGRAIMPPGSAFLTVLSFAAVTAFALALNWRATHRLVAALDAATAEIDARDTAEAELDRTSDILSAIVRSSPVATQAF